MSEAEHQLLEALQVLERSAAGDGQPGPRPGLGAALRAVAAAAERLPPDTDPELRHYLSRRSYEKARAWLEGRTPEPGACTR